MASVVFLRGVNVGGHKAFSPAGLARELAEFDVVNVGAAGTFVVRKAVGQAAMRAALLRRLAFEPEVMICRAKEVLDLAAAEPFADAPESANVTRYVTVLAKVPKTRPALPIEQPAGEWQVKVTGVVGRFVLSFARRTGKALVYPNEVVEKRFGVPATTRNWNTIATVCEILSA